MAKISRETVEQAARLVRIDLTESELEKYTSNLSDVVVFIDQLNQVDTTSAEPIRQITGLENVMREDVVTNTNMREELLANAPMQENGFLKVKVVK